MYLNQMELKLEYIIPILVALIAAVITLWQIKLNNITSSRIKWIESMRLLVSDYCIEAIRLNELLNILNLKQKNNGRTLDNKHISDENYKKLESFTYNLDRQT
jgi:hypothetical protein